MAHPIRFLLLRLLLVAVLFNTAIGVPLHALEHLREASAGERLAEAQDEPPEAHAACAWCISYAGLAHALDAAPPWHCAPMAHRRATRPAAAIPPGAERWPFRARDPPQA